MIEPDKLKRRTDTAVWKQIVAKYQATSTPRAVWQLLKSPRWRRVAYRLARNPVILFLIAPLYIFLIGQRFPSPNADKRERRSVGWMNLAILGMVIGLCAIFGMKAYLLILLLTFGIAG